MFLTRDPPTFPQKNPITVVIIEYADIGKNKTLHEA